MTGIPSSSRGRLRVLYNATFVRTGGGFTYCQAQIEALARVDGIELTVLSASWNHDQLRAVVPDSVKLVAVAVSTVPARFAWEQFVLPMRARRYDLLLSPGNFASFACPVPQVVVLQNSNYVGDGRSLAANAVFGERVKIVLSHLSMRRADLVVSISDSLTAAIRSEGDLDGINLVTVKSGSPQPDLDGSSCGEEAIDEVDRLVGAEPYVLSVANDYPHKRLDDLAQLPSHLARHEPMPTRVVFAGDVSSERRHRLRALAGAHHGSLVFLGPVSDRSIVLELYRRAAVAVSASELEAFPLILHEALSQGSPLAVADIAPHRELGGEQAHYFPVGDLEALVAAIEAALTGPRPEPTFQSRSWGDHADELASYLRAVAAKEPPGQANAHPT